jgi:hypothetical protein
LIDIRRISWPDPITLTWSEDGIPRLWDIEVDYDFPEEHLELIVKVATGTTMDDYGNITVLSKKLWEENREEYFQIAEDHIKKCEYKNANSYLKYQKQNWRKND